MVGAKFDGKLNADSLHVGGMLLMRSQDQNEEGQNQATFKAVKLPGAKVDGNVVVVGAKFDGELNANSMHVGGMLLMRSQDQNEEGQNQATFMDVNLRGVKVDGDVFMVDAKFAKVNMVFAHVGAILDLCGASLAEMNLSGASIAGDLRLGRNCKSSAVWKGNRGILGAHSCAIRISPIWWMRGMHGRPRGSSTLMGSASVISVDLPAKRGRRYSSIEWTGGTVGRGSIPTTARLPMRNSPPYSQARAIATPQTRSVTAAVCGSAGWKVDWPTFGLDSFSM